MRASLPSCVPMRYRRGRPAPAGKSEPSVHPVPLRGRAPLPRKGGSVDRLQARQNARPRRRTRFHDSVARQQRRPARRTAVIPCAFPDLTGASIAGENLLHSRFGWGMDRHESIAIDSHSHIRRPDHAQTRTHRCARFLRSGVRPRPCRGRGQPVLIPPALPHRADARRVHPADRHQGERRVREEGDGGKNQGRGREQPGRCDSDRRRRPARCATPGRTAPARQLEGSRRNDPLPSAPPRRAVVRAHDPCPRRPRVEGP